MDLVMDQLDSPFDEAVEIVGLAFLGRLAGEGQQVAHDFAAAQAFAFDGLEAFPLLLVA